MKKILKLIVVCPIIIGIIIAISITVKNNLNKINEEEKIKNIFGNLSSKSSEVTKFYTYGTSLNIETRINGIEEDNFEGAKLILTDGEKFEKTYSLEYTFDDSGVSFSTGNVINKAINLDEFESGKKYYFKIRVRVNNSKDYKYYTLENTSPYKNIEYYTLTKDGKNNKINIKFEKKDYEGKKYNYLSLNVSESKLPDNVYDIVIDSGHGGSEKGNTNGEYNERDLMLEYGKALKEKLEEKGYKVKLVRDNNDSELMTEKNSYDENGRIQVACRTKAKYMISLHNTDGGYSGFEVYIPNNSDRTLAKAIADKLYNETNLEYSNNKLYKKEDGIYLENYDKESIRVNNEKMQKLGVEPYNLTLDTPMIFTIREVGGIATNAYVDGRDSRYSKNEFYDSNQGIESYRINVGNIKSDIDVILSQKDQIVKSIADCF